VKRHYNLQKLTFGLTVLAALSFAFPRFAMPQANAASAQTIPAINAAPPGARDADTFQSDKALDAACRKSGQNTAVCLCLIHVMKYEMSLTSYRAAPRLFGQSGDRAELHRKLYSEGYRKSDVETAEHMERSLITAVDFAPRCAESKAYYRKPAK